MTSKEILNLIKEKLQEEINKWKNIRKERDLYKQRIDKLENALNQIAFSECTECTSANIAQRILNEKEGYI